MKIISKFKDYYDSVVRSGMDPKIVYVRNSEEIQLKVKKSFSDSIIPDKYHQALYNLIGLEVGGRIFNQTGYIYFTSRGLDGGTSPIGHLFAVVVGGMIYRGIKLCLVGSPDLYFYSYESFEDFCEKSKTSINMFGVNMRNIREFFSRPLEDAIVSQYCIENCVPVCLVICERVSGSYSYVPKVIHNPFLKEIEFYRAMDPYTIFQEIQMVVSCMAFKEKPLVEVSDKCKIEGHGFDYKYSFRNRKKEG